MECAFPESFIAWFRLVKSVCPVPYACVQYLLMYARTRKLVFRHKIYIVVKKTNFVWIWHVRFYLKPMWHQSQKRNMVANSRDFHLTYLECALFLHSCACAPALSVVLREIKHCAKYLGLRRIGNRSVITVPHVIQPSAERAWKATK